MNSNFCRTIGVLAVLGCALTANAQGRIYSIAAHTATSGTEIEIRGEKIARPKVTRGAFNHSYILDFGAPYSGGSERVDLNSGGVTYFNYGRHTPTTARLHVKLAGNYKPTLQHISDGWKVTINTPSQPVASHVNRDAQFVPVGFAHDYVMPAFEPASKMITTTSTKPMKLTPMAAALYTSKPIEPVTVAPTALALKTSVQTLTPATTSAATDIKSITTPEPIASIAARLTAVEPTMSLPVTTAIAAAPSIVNTVVVSTDKADQPITDGTPVPQKKSSKKVTAKKAGNADASAAYSAPSQPTNTFDKRVTLDFANTDVVQVLKALALQAGVNIVTSPDVTGKVTVSLDNVTVKDALDLVTTMAGVRYAKIGSTFIVTSPARFSDSLKQISGQADETQETRVVPIYSGMGSQIKAAISKAIAANSASNYTMILPSENAAAAAAAATPPAPAAAPGAPAAGAAAPAPATAAPTGPKVKDNYVVLVGSKSKLDEVEAQVKELDTQLCRSLLITIPTNVEAVTTVYKTTSNSARGLLGAVVEPEHVSELKDQPNRTTVGRVLLYATTMGSEGDQSIILHGPKNEVDLMVNLLGQLDAPVSAANSHVHVYNVHFGDPRALKEELLIQIPGLRVTLPSPSAGSPSIFKPNDNRSDAGTQGFVGDQHPSGSSAPGGTGSQIDPLTGATSSNDSNFNLPLARLEVGALPMRLVLKGTENQIDSALEYLKMVDVAPKQVALEMRVMELSKDDAINAGVSWDITTGGAVKTIKLNNASNATSTQNSGTVNFGGKYLGGSVTAQLDKIATSSNLISRPNLLAIDGRESEIFIGDDIRYVASIISSQNGPTVTTSSVSVGVRLSVLPRCGDDGSITMDLRPVVSFLKGFTNVSQSGITLQLPQTSSRQSQSTINIKSGETIAIGGLIQEEDVRSVQGLPILMNLPIIGNLFKRTNNDKTHTELVIFLTARVTDGPAMSTSRLPMEASMDKAVRKNKGK